jgi:isopropylmalate/homocitrate/citramalate synthase
VTQIQLYDTTLRDGMQGEGMSLSAAEKLRVAHRLDELGIDLIEAGFPSSNPKELELFALLAAERFGHAQVAAFGMTRRREVSADADPALRILAECFAPVCTLVGKTWSLHLEKVVRVGRDENLRMIEESVAFLVGEGKRVIYDAEHFFDGFADDPQYALACLPLRGPGRRPWCAATPTAGRCRTRWRAPWGRSAPRSAATACGSASTATTTRAAGSRTRSPPWPPARHRCRGR